MDIMTYTKEPILTYYETKSTSKQSVQINKIILNETGSTRRTLQSTIVNNDENPESKLQIIILNEKKGENGFASEDLPDLRTLKSGESLSFKLGSEDALALYKELERHYALPNTGPITQGERKHLVIEVDKSDELSINDANSLIKLLAHNSNMPDMAKNLSKLSPKLIANTHRLQLFEKKREAVEQFRIMLNSTPSEQEWQSFFKEQNWIFGGIHDIHFLTDLNERPILSGANVEGKGEKQGDFLACTSGNARFTGIIEIKRSDTLLLKHKTYRPGVFIPSEELIGGLTQLRTYLRKWQTEGSRTDENKDLLEGIGIYTIQPTGFLIIGNLNEIKDSRQKREAFETFRQQQKDIYILTFDEVFARSEHLLGKDD